MLVLLVQLVCERNHLVVTLGQQTDSVDHASEEAGGESTSREAEHVDLVSAIVLVHQKLVAGHDMGVEGCGKTLVDSPRDLACEVANDALVERAAANVICTDTSCRPVSTTVQDGPEAPEICF